MKLITKIKKADYPKKTTLWIEANLFGEERDAIVREMVLSMPKGAYHLYNREYGENLVDAVWEKYGWMPSMLIDEKMIFGLTYTHPKKVRASFTLDLDIVELL